MKKFYVVKRKYTIFAIAFLMLSLICLVCLFIYFFMDNSMLFGLIMFALWITATVETLYNCSKKIEITKEGVKFISFLKKYSLSWEEIRVIGISDVVFIIPGRKPVIYFSTEKEPRMYVSGDMQKENFIMANYRKSIVDEVAKYWPHEIQNLYRGRLPKR